VNDSGVVRKASARNDASDVLSARVIAGGGEGGEKFYFCAYLWQPPHGGLPGPRNLLAMPTAREKNVAREGFAEPLSFARLTADRK